MSWRVAGLCRSQHLHLLLESVIRAKWWISIPNRILSLLAAMVRGNEPNLSGGRVIDNGLSLLSSGRSRDMHKFPTEFEGHHERYQFQA